MKQKKKAAFFVSMYIEREREKNRLINDAERKINRVQVSSYRHLSHYLINSD